MSINSSSKEIPIQRKAALFASKIHRKNINHSAAVVASLKEIGVQDDNILAAAWLYKIREISPITSNKLKKEFNHEIASIVESLTNLNKEDNPQEIDYAVNLIKVAEIIQNCRINYMNLPEIILKKKIKECLSVDAVLAQKVSPRLYEQLLSNLRILIEHKNLISGEFNI